MTMNQLVVVAVVLITLVLISPDGDCTTGGKGVLSVFLVSGFTSYLSSAQQQSYFRRHYHRRHNQKTKTTTTRQALRSSNNDSKENGEGVMITIEYCPGCRWMTKSFWLATEIFQKFNSNISDNKDSNNSSQPPIKIQGITIIPSLPGTFKVTAQKKNNNNDYYYNQILWDREVDDGFPPMDLIQFEQRIENYLYSQSLLQKEKNDNDVEEEDKEEDKSRVTTNTNYVTTVKAVEAIEAGTEPQIIIRFGNSSPTNQQQYLFRSIYYGQELFTTFNDGEIKSIALLPTTTTTDTTNHNHNNVRTTTTGRHFSIGLKMDGSYSSSKIDDDDDNKEICLWDNNNDNLRRNDDSPSVKSALSLFPEVKVLKRLVRNYVNSEKDLGHSDEGKDNSNTNINTNSNDDDTTKITIGEEKKIEDIKKAIIALQQVLIEIGSSSTTTTTNNNNTIIVVKENDENDAEEEEDAENQRRYFGVL